MTDETQTVERHESHVAVRGPALVVAWSREEPHRIGERMLFTDGITVLFGRGPAHAKDPVARTWPVKMRPGQTIDGGPFTSRTLSKIQALITRKGSALQVENKGRASLIVNGAAPGDGLVTAGDVLSFDGRLVLICVDSPNAMPPMANVPMHPFGMADELGIVGESDAAWELRRQIAFAGPRDAHVLVYGPSGAGKELVARGLHYRSTRSDGPWIDRNAATLPEGLVDAELFGHARNFPNPGMPQRKGIVGEADGGTLFLDEFGELPQGAQAHLLRVLDEGRYQRLGETDALTSNFRFVAATNRPISALKHDLRARLRLLVEVPGLGARREDIPLLQRHLLERILATDLDLARQFAGHPPQFSQLFLLSALNHDWTTHARELEGWIWNSLASGIETWIEPPEPQATPRPAPNGIGPTSTWRDWVGKEPADIPAAALNACLDEHNGNQVLVWQALGFNSRYVLRRLIKRHGLAVTRRG